MGLWGHPMNRRVSSVPNQIFCGTLIFLAIGLLPVTALAQTYIYNQAGLRTGAAPSAVAVADLNADGRPDLIVANTNDNTVSVILSRSDGSFAPKVDYAVGAAPQGVAIGDFNGDHIPDIVVVNSGGNTVSILLGLGDGSFGTQVTYPTGAVPVSIVTGDFNGDKRLDLAVANQQDGTVSILLGNGDGTFGSQTTISVTGNPFAIVSADFNGDGKPDLAALDPHANLSILLNAGNSTFSVNSHLVGQSASAIAVGDFNGDNSPDIAVVDTTGNQILILLGTGNGQFQTHSGASASSPVTVAVGDFDHDGKLDLAVGLGNQTLFPSSIAIFRGNGDGSFQNPIITGCPGNVPLLVSSDFNNDNNVDLAALDAKDEVLILLLGRGDASFGGHTDITFPASGGISGAVAADFNGDGKLDVAIAQFNQNMQGITGFISLLPGNGDGTFQSPVSTQTPNIGIDRMVVGDFDGDGKPDIAMNDVAGNGGVAVLISNGDGTFGPAVTSFTGLTGLNTQAIAAGDLNKDGKADLAVLSLDSSNPFSPLWSFLSKGDGTFQSNLVYDVPEIASSVAIGDFNHDGNPDIAVAAAVQNSLFIFLGRGDGTFLNPTIYNTGALFTNNVVAGDFNGDGNIDLVVGTEQGILFYAGNGNGTFQPPIKTATPFSVVELFSDIFGGNSKPSLAMLGNDNPSVFISLSNGDGTFQAPLPFEATYFPRTFTTGDFNGDGSADLMFFSTSDPQSVVPQTISVWLSTPAVIFSSSNLAFGTQNVGTASPPQSIGLTNSGTAPLLLNKIAATGNFSETNDCPTSLLIGKGCTINVSFTPTANGLSSGLLVFTDNANSPSQMLPLTGWAGPPDFAISSLPSSNSVAAGSSAIYFLTLTPGGGFSGTAQLQCSGAPSKASCLLATSSVQLSGSGPVAVQVTVTTAAPSVSALVPLARRPASVSFFSPAWLLAFAMIVGLVCLTNDRRRAWAMVATLAVAMALTSCGGGSSSTAPIVTTIPGTPPGSYILTVTATSGNLSHSAALNLSVN
jgi:hypothetical protein